MLPQCSLVCVCRINFEYRCIDKCLCVVNLLMLMCSQHARSLGSTCTQQFQVCPSPSGPPHHAEQADCTRAQCFGRIWDDGSMYYAMQCALTRLCSQHCPAEPRLLAAAVPAQRAMRETHQLCASTKHKATNWRKHPHPNHKNTGRLIWWGCWLFLAYQA
jgi:hypothetical protein